MELTQLFNTPLHDIFPYERTKGRYGIEVEVEGNNLPGVVKGWKVHKEGSLRGEANEYVTDGAVKTTDLPAILTYLEVELSRKAVRVFEGSHRASTHIHINMQDKTIHDVIGSLIIFQIVEPVFMRFCGPNRDGNLFCLPTYDCGEFSKWLETKFLKRLPTHGLDMGFAARGKYSALNVDPLNKFGTLEFRTFPCSIRKKKILEWVNWCTSVVDAAVHCNDPVFESEVQKAYNNPIEYIEKIFGEDAMKNYGLDPFTATKAIRAGCEEAYESVRVYTKFRKTHILKEAA